MTGLAASPAGGAVFSAGFDDCVREIGSDGFTLVSRVYSFSILADESSTDQHLSHSPLSQNRSLSPMMGRSLW